MSSTLAMQHAMCARLATSVRQSSQNKGRAAARATIGQSARVVSASASSSDTSVVVMPSSGRRSALFAGLSAAAAFASSAGPARAERGDGIFLRKTVCDPTEDGAECRAAELGKDTAELGDYESKSARTVTMANSQTNPDYSNYQVQTLELVSDVEAVLALDLYDLTREKRISALKKEGNTWCSKYAPGGSAKTASG
jgi:hypothetical protein